MTVFWDRPKAFLVVIVGTDAVVSVTASTWTETDGCVEFSVSVRMETEERRDLGIHVPPHDQPQDRVELVVARFPKALVASIDNGEAGS